MNHLMQKATVFLLVLALYGCRYENAGDPPAAALCDTVAVTYS
jgi:hypothetical protein